MPKPAEYVVGSYVFRAGDRVPLTYQTDYRAAFNGFSKDEIEATHTVKAAGGTRVQLDKDGHPEVINAADFAKQIHLDLGHYHEPISSDSRQHYVRHPQDAYDNPVQGIDPSSKAEGYASKLTLTVRDEDTGEVKEVPRVKSAIDFGHAMPHVQSLHRQDFIQFPLGEGHTMTHHERLAINLETNKAHFVLGHVPRVTQSTYQAGALQGLDRSHYKDVHDVPPRDCPDYKGPAEFAKRTHVTLGFDKPQFRTDTRDAYVRHPQDAYDNPVQSVDPSAWSGADGKDQTKVAVTTVTGAVRQVNRVKSAIDFGHDDQHHVSITMGLQHTTQPTMTRQLGAGHRTYAFHQVPYVPTFRNIKYSVNESHPALQKQAQLEKEEKERAAGTAFETSILAAAYSDNCDVAFKIRAAGKPPQSMAYRAGIQKVVNQFGGQTLSPNDTVISGSTTRLEGAAK